MGGQAISWDQVDDNNRDTKLERERESDNSGSINHAFGPPFSNMSRKIVKTVRDRTGLWLGAIYCLSLFL